MKKLSVTQVNRSIRKFNNYGDDVLNAKHQTFGQFLSIFINHCESDPVMKVITEQLRNNKNVLFSEWFYEFENSRGGMVGSARYSLPTDEEDRLAIFYQLLLKINSEEINLINFCSDAYGHINFDEMIWNFNEQIFGKFVRDVNDRLEELQEDIQSKTEVTTEDLFIFNHFDKQIFISDIKNSNVSVDGSSITINEINDVQELQSGFNNILNDLKGTNGEALSILKKINTNDLENGNKIEIANIVSEAIKHEPSLKEKLLYFTNSVSAGLTSTAIVGAIKFVIG